MHGNGKGGASGFQMLPGMTMRYDMPNPGLRTGVTGYNLYRIDDPQERVDWFLPAPAMLCIGIRNGPVHGQIGNRKFASLPQAFIIGPSSTALQMTTHGGTMTGIGISAAGWAQLGLGSASALHNRIVPATDLLGRHVVEGLQDTLEAMPDDAALKGRFDALLKPLFQQEDAMQPLIAALTTLSVTDGVIKTSDVAERLAVLPSTLLRVSQRYFGLTPKLLLRRSRFLRSFMQMFVADAVGQAGAIDSSYHDMSHYLRDANTFLGTTPRRFMQIATPVLKASIHLRAATLGTPTQALHDGTATPT